SCLCSLLEVPRCPGRECTSAIDVGIDSNGFDSRFCTTSNQGSPRNRLGQNFIASVTCQVAVCGMASAPNKRSASRRQGLYDAAIGYDPFPAATGAQTAQFASKPLEIRQFFFDGSAVLFSNAIHFGAGARLLR